MAFVTFPINSLTCLCGSYFPFLPSWTYLHISSIIGVPFHQHTHLPTVVGITSNCIVESFARFPLPGYLLLESQLREYMMGIFYKGDRHKTSSSALLFEEGPINDYREDVVLCNLWCEALKKLCTSHHSKEDVSSQMSQLYTLCMENLLKIADRYSLKKGSSALPPLFSKEGSLVTLALYTNLNILHFLQESGKVADDKVPSQWSIVDVCKDTLTQYCCLSQECFSPVGPSSVWRKQQCPWLTVFSTTQHILVPPACFGSLLRQVL